MGAWKFGRRQGACAACEHGFVDGEELYSLLRLSEEDLERGDLCTPCFEARDEAQDVIFWRTRHNAERGTLKVDFDLVLAALPHLAGDKRPERRDLAFLLSLLLVRHRKLRMQSVTRKKGVEYMVLRKPRTQKTIDVEARTLDAERRERLTAQLTEMLDPTREGSFEDLVQEAEAASE